MFLAEFPVQRKKGRYRSCRSQGLSLSGAAGRSAAGDARTRLSWRLRGYGRLADCPLSCFPQLRQGIAFAVDSRFPIGEERFPWHALGVGDPLLIGFRIAAGGGLLLDDRALGLAEPVVNLGKFALVLSLDAEMREAGSSAGVLQPVLIAKFTRGSSSIHFA